MSEFSFLNQPWTYNKLWAMTVGHAAPDSDSGDGYLDVPSSSWYMKSCAAIDNGDVELMHDVIQYERAIHAIPDRKAKAAVVLAMHGWDFAEIGAAINDYKTGYQLVRQGVRSMFRHEQRRAESNE